MRSGKVLSELSKSSQKLIRATVLCTKSPGSGDFSVQPLCPLCLCGVLCSEFINHIDTEDTEVAQRRARSRLLVQAQESHQAGNISGVYPIGGEASWALAKKFP